MTNLASYALPIHLLITAKIRQLNQLGLYTYILQKGEKNSGSLLIKVNMLDGNGGLYSQARDINGDLTWMNVLKHEISSEQDIDKYIERMKNIDPDIWIIEVENKSGFNPFDEK